jgi:hypothetical protein
MLLHPFLDTYLSLVRSKPRVRVLRRLATFTAQSTLQTFAACLAAFGASRTPTGTVQLWQMNAVL